MELISAKSFLIESDLFHNDSTVILVAVSLYGSMLDWQSMGLRFDLGQLFHPVSFVHFTSSLCWFTCLMKRLIEQKGR